MPLLRYFVFIGGVLIALLFISDAYLPKLAVAEATNTGVDKTVIRIHSDRKWPERVVFDTSLPTMAPPAIIASARAEAETGVQAPATSADVSTKIRARDSYAQLQPADTKQVHTVDLRKPQRKRRMAKRRVAPSMVVVAQQPTFGFFGNATW
jgi:hypothetical protein